MVITSEEAMVEESVCLRDDATGVLDENGRLLLSRDSKRFEVGPLLAELVPSLEILLADGAPEEVLRGMVSQNTQAVEQLHVLLRRMDDRGWLQRVLTFKGQPLLTMKPLVAKPQDRQAPDVAGVVTLSRFALLRRVGAELVLESPRSSAVAVVHDPRVGAFVTSLCRPVLVDQLDAEAIGLPASVLSVVATLLGDASFLVDRKSTRLNSSHIQKSRMPSSA